MSKQNNQIFIFIPFNMPTDILKYKFEEIDVNVEIVEESYTSKCSSLDNEVIRKYDRKY